MNSTSALNATGRDVEYDPSALDYDSLDTTPAAGRAMRDIALPVVCALGVCGIALTLVVLSRKNMSTSTNCYLLALAAADLLFLLLLCTRLLERRLEPASARYYAFQIYATYASAALSALLLASIWITVMLAVERYIAICRPFLAAKLCSRRRARLIVALVFVLCVAVRAPTLLMHRVMRVRDPSTNATLVYIVDAPLAHNTCFTTLYPWLVDVAIMSVLPFALLLVLNACLIYQVRRSSAYLQRSLLGRSGGEAGVVQRREELQVTSMLISVIVVFFLCQAPYVLYTAIAATHRFTPLPAILVFRYAAMLLLTLKSALNFVLYCWFSEKFWATFKRVFRVEALARKLRLRRSGIGGRGGEYGGGSGPGEQYHYMKRLSSSANTRVTCLDT